jgi:hypothetical protein
MGRVVIMDDSTYQSSFEVQDGKELPKIDFETEMVVGISFWNDCNARYFHGINVNLKDRIFHFFFASCYGGCAAMRSGEKWFVCRRLPDGFHLDFLPKDERTGSVEVDTVDYDLPSHLKNSAALTEKPGFDPCFWEGSFSKYQDRDYAQLDHSIPIIDYIREYDQLRLKGKWQMVKPEEKNPKKTADFSKATFLQFSKDSSSEDKICTLYIGKKEKGAYGYQLLIDEGEFGVLQCSDQLPWNKIWVYYYLVDDQLSIWPSLNESTQEGLYGPAPYVFKKVITEWTPYQIELWFSPGNVKSFPYRNQLFVF